LLLKRVFHTIEFLMEGPILEWAPADLTAHDLDQDLLSRAEKLFATTSIHTGTSEGVARLEEIIASGHFHPDCEAEVRQELSHLLRVEQVAMLASVLQREAEMIM